MTSLIAGALALLLTGLLPQQTDDLRKAIGQPRRVCGVVVTYDSLGKDGTGNCGTKFYLGTTERKPKYYFVIPHAVGSRFLAPVRNVLPGQRVCVSGEIAIDKKSVPHTTIIAPSQVEAPQASEGPSFGSGAHHLCEAGMVTPVLIKEVKPDYPSAEYVRKKLEDVVLVQVVIGEDGAVIDARVTDGRYAGFNQSALEAVRQWRFRPATRSGQPVRAVAKVELTFTLR